MMRFAFLTTLTFLAILSLFSNSGLHAKTPDDVIAKVGDQIITLKQIDIMINSSPIQGLPAPPVGTPERNTVRLTVLDRIISANLLYLDALKQGIDKDPGYQRDVTRFADAVLASVYKREYLIEDIPVTEKEIQKFHKNNIAAGTELTEEVKMAIEASLRKERFKHRNARVRAQLRDGIEVVVFNKELDPGEDAIRDDEDMVAMIDQKPITWGEVKNLLKGRYLASRIEALNKLIDNRIMINKAKGKGLEQDPVYQARVKEFKKTRLINHQRKKLTQEMGPTDKEISAFFEKNKERISFKEHRKVQMVVLKTKAEAEEIKQKIKAGDLTIYEAAMEFSIDPNAKKTLGEIGWVSQGSGFPALDKLTFSLEPEVLGGPVESPAGWHLVKVLDFRDAQFQNLEDANTRKKTRRMLIHSKLDDYVIDLRKHHFQVEVYNDVLNRLLTEEVKWAQAKNEQALKNPSATQKVFEDLKNQSN